MTIDSADSILHTQVLGTAKPKCLSEYRQCCLYRAELLKIDNYLDSDYGLFDCFSSFKLLANSMEFDCFANWPMSLF